MSASGNSLILTSSSIFTRRVLRYGLGSAFIMGVAMSMKWPLAFMLPILALSFLAAPQNAPGIKAGLSFIGVIAGACLVAVLFSKLLLPFPLILLPLMFLALLHLFHSELAPLLKTWLMIAFMLIPLLGAQSMALAETLAMGIVMGAGLSILMVWGIYFFIPPVSQAEGAAPPAAPPPKPGPRERFVSALTSTLVVFPVWVLFILFEWAGALVILIFISLLSMQPAFAKNFKGGIALILGNLIGGLASILIYELLVIMPDYYFMIMLILLSGLIFGAQVFSGKKTAPLYGMAFSTLLLVIGSTTGGDAEADAKVWSRIWQIMTAVLYVVFAFGFIDRWKQASRKLKTQALNKEPT